MAVTLIVIYRYNAAPVSTPGSSVRTIAISAATASGIVGAGFNVSAIIGAHWMG
jgi:hypothetical protein